MKTGRDGWEGGRPRVLGAKDSMLNSLGLFCFWEEMVRNALCTPKCENV